MIVNYTSFNENASFQLRKFDFDGLSDFLGLTEYYRPRKDFLYIPKNTVSIVLAGEKSMYYNGKLVNMRSGDVLFIPAGTYLFSNICWKETHFKSANIYLDNAFIDLPDQKSPVLLPKLTTLKNNFPSTSSLITRKMRESKNHLSYEEAGPVMQELTNQFELAKEDTGDQFLFKSKIHTQLLSFSRLPEFADACNMSLATFKRHFNLVFKEPPKKWLINKRLELADFYLITRNHLVKDVCYMTGFNNLSYFIQLYKRRFGYLPRRC